MRGGQVIREARRRAGLTQQELASRIGQAQSTIARWESDAVSPTVETLSRLLAACGYQLVPRLVPTDEAEWSLVIENLARTPDERLDKLTEAAAFFQEGQKAMRAALDA